MRNNRFADIYALFNDDNIYNWEPDEMNPLPMKRARPLADGILPLVRERKNGQRWLWRCQA